MNYYLWIDGQEHGPYTLEQILAAVADGSISPSQTARTEDSSEWKPLQDIVNLRREPPKQPPPPAPKPTKGEDEPFPDLGILFAPSGAPSLPSDEATMKRVADYLGFLRRNSSYGLLRTLIECATWLTAIGLFVAGLNLLDTALGASKILGGCLLFVGIPIALAARQSSLLLVDIADSFLHEHSKTNDRNA